MFEYKFKSYLVPRNIELDLLLVSLLVLLYFDGMIFVLTIIYTNQIHQNWNELKHSMYYIFVTPYYQCELGLKLQYLNLGSKSAEECYRELIIGITCCKI